MKIIFISGPSGSGKTTLSKLLKLKIKNGIVLSTDNYYKTSLASKLLSKFVESYFDRSISFNAKLFKMDFNYILKYGISIHERSYNFEKKTAKKFLIKTNNINFLIVEGIFAREFLSTLNNQNYFFLELKISKDECLKRVLQRDYNERGKAKNTAKKDFLKSWDIYQEKLKNKRIKNKKNEYIITKNTKIDQIIKKIFT